VFLDLFYGLRDEGVPVSIQEWQMLMTAMEEGMHRSDLLTFYNLSKSLLVKRERDLLRCLRPGLRARLPRRRDGALAER
jgi:uncharacterized protein with von Willebrand factor type A (vWA) domain